MRLNKIALGLTTLMLTALMIPLAFAQPTWSLNIYSLGVGGAAVPFTLNGAPQVTPYSATLPEGTYTVAMPPTVTIGVNTYNFVVWDGGSTNPTRTIILTQDTSIYAHYELVPPPPPPPPPPHGESPGYWKHQFLAYIDGKGKPQETWADLVDWTADIDAYYSNAPPDFYGYALPPVSSLDIDSSGTFTTVDAYNIFKDKAWKELWIGLANWYNWAAGLGPYET